MTKNPYERQAESRTRTIMISALSAVVVGLIVGVFIINSSASSKPEEPGGTLPPPATAEGRDWDVVLHTSVGEIDLVLDGAAAPQAVASFVSLASEGFFDGTQCHRLLPSSLLQCGDPTGTGTGGPGYSFGPIENAPSSNVYPAGSVAMARVGGDGESMGSQFFLVFNDVLLPADRAGGYTVMGSVSAGLDVLIDVAEAGTVDGSTDGRPLTSVIIERVEVS